MLRAADKRRQIGKPLGAVFGPDNPLPVMANLQAWYDCSDVATLTIVSNKVSQWDDKSGNGFNLTQGTAGTRPLYDGTPRTIKGVIVPEFAGAQYMSSSCPADDRTSTTFVAYVQDSSATSNWQLYGSSSGGGLGIRLEVTTARWRTLKDGVAFLTNTQLAFPGNCVFCHRLTGTTIEQNFMGNSFVLSESTALTASTTLRLGSESSGSVFWDGLIAEFIRYSTTLSDSDMAAVQSYLFRKWFVT